jgi:Flp pilus assembly protein TadD
MATNRVPYRTSLRVLGRLLNGDKARMVTVCEIEQGFLLHYFARGEPQGVTSRAIHSAEVMDLDDVLHKQRGKPAPSGALKDLQSVFGLRPDEALRFQKSHPLCPLGYEEFLRALGAGLDRRHARAILITELDERIHVEYTVDRADFVVRQGQRMALPGRRQENYTAQQIATFVQTHHQRAIEEVQRSGQHLSFNPMDVGSYLAAAPVLEDHDQYREAEDLYRTALDIAPEHPEVHYHLACHARRRGDRKAALKHVQRALSHSGGEGRYFHLLGRLNVERNNLGEALQALQGAISCDPENTVYHFHLSQVYERLGRDSDASGHEAPGARRRAPESEAPESEAPDDRRPAGGGSQSLHNAPEDSSLTPDAWRPAPDVGAAPRRSLAARLEDSVPATDEEPVPSAAWESRPTTPAYPVTSGPFEGAAPSGRRPGLPPTAGESFGTPALPPHVERPFPSDAPMAGAPGDEFGGDGLPTLGLADNWSTQRLPALEVPADGAAAAAALPLAGVHLDRPLPDATPAHEPRGTRKSEAPSWTPPDVMPAQAGTPEPALSSTTEDAVQLAAAIMRAEELVRAEPQRADLHRKLGFLLAKQGRSEDAATEFRRAVECGRRRVQ